MEGSNDCGQFQNNYVWDARKLERAEINPSEYSRQIVNLLGTRNGTIDKDKTFGKKGKGQNKGTKTSPRHFAYHYLIRRNFRALALCENRKFIAHLQILGFQKPEKWQYK